MSLAGISMSRNKERSCGNNKENKPDGKWSTPKPVITTSMKSKTPHMAVDKTGILAGGGRGA